jgi:hypothetical protein
MTAGRKPFDRQKEPPWERRGRLAYGTREWKMLRLQQRLPKSAKQRAALAGNHLSSGAAGDEATALFRDLRVEFERAVLDGDALWFKRQEKAIRHKHKPKDQFVATLNDLLDIAEYLACGLLGPRLGEPLRRLPPIFVSAEELLSKMQVEKRPNGELVVEGRVFGSNGTHTARDRVLGEIRRATKKRGLPRRSEQRKKNVTDCQSAVPRGSK